MIQLYGPRIILRDYTVDDLDAMHAWMSDPDITRYITWGSHNREETLLILADCIREQQRVERQKYFFTIVSREDATRAVGDAGIVWCNRRNDSGEGEISYYLLKPYWGKGYASEAAKLVIDFGFSQLGMHRIIATCAAENTASVCVMERCGMVKEAELRKSIFLSGAWRNQYVYAILREEWKSGSE